MNKTLHLFALLSLITTALSVPVIQKCKLNDAPCLQKSAISAWNRVLGGVPELGVENSDPLYLESVKSDLAGLKYDFSEVTAKGFRDCDVKNVKPDLDKNKMKLDLYCKVDFAGKYDMSGRLLVLPVEGKGDFTIKVKQILLSVNTDLKQTEKNGKNYYSVKKFEITYLEAKDTVVFDFKNLFNGNKQLSDGVHKFANSNYKEVTKELSSPLFNACIKKNIKNINKYLKETPQDDLFIL